LNDYDYTTLAEVDYVNTTQGAFGNSVISGKAIFSDASIDPQTTYVYRASHLHKEQLLFTSVIVIPTKYRDETDYYTA
jgi:hypothetical protein